MTDKERDKEDEIIKAETPSTEYTLSGYLDNQADGFPEIHQTWHGAEGDIYYLVSEKGFNRLSTKRKTFCMELNVEKKKEKKIMHEIQKILSAENQRRKSNTPRPFYIQKCFRKTFIRRPVTQFFNDLQIFF